MSERKYETYSALETVITKVSSQIAISRNVQLDLQWNRTHRRDAFFSSIYAHLYLMSQLSPLTFRPFLNLNLNLMNLLLSPLPAAANLNSLHSMLLMLLIYIKIKRLSTYFHTCAHSHQPQIQKMHNFQSCMLTFFPIVYTQHEQP